MDANHLEKYHDQIDAYLRDELSLEDRALFEQSLQSNPELLNEFRLHQQLFTQMDDSSWMNESFVHDKDEVKQIETYFKSTDAQNFKKTVEKAFINYKTKKNSSITKYRFFIPLLAAASIALFVVLYNINSAVNTIDLYTEYSQWEDLPSLTSRSDDGKLATGQRLFEEGRYKDSYSLFETYNQSTAEIVPSVLIYSGLSALELNKYKEAISYFDKLIASDAVDQSKGYWYKALVYLKQDQREEAIKVLRIVLRDKENYKFKEAEVVLKKLQ